MIADPIAKLRSVGRSLPPKVHAAVLALAPEVIPRLIDLLNDVDGGWASVHAADLLVDLKATEAIEPMLHTLAELDFDDSLFNRVVVRLPELGAVVLEPALAFLADHEDDEDTVQSVCEVLGKLGVKDEQVTPQASFLEDLGADSLDTVELIMAFEEEFKDEIKGEIPETDAEKLRTVGQVVDYIKAKAAAK